MRQFKSLIIRKLSFNAPQHITELGPLKYVKFSFDKVEKGRCLLLKRVPQTTTGIKQLPFLAIYIGLLSKNPSF